MPSTLLIGTNNVAKIKRWSRYFSDLFQIVSLKDCGILQTVEESLHDLRWNAIKKATTYAALSGKLTLSEDTGFFISELGGLPGVAVRRWGWELPNDISDEAFLSFFKEKVKHLKDRSAYFEYEIAIALPNGIFTTINKKSPGFIDLEKLETIEGHEGGYPLSKCIVHHSNGKTWFECSEEERELRDKEIIEEVREVFKKYFSQGKL